MLPSLAPSVPVPELAASALEINILLVQACMNARRLPAHCPSFDQALRPSSDVPIAARPLFVSARSAPSIPHGKTNGLPPPLAASSLGPRALLIAACPAFCVAHCPVTVMSAMDTMDSPHHLCSHLSAPRGSERPCTVNPKPWKLNILPM